jgi:methyltransferase (TIGR00027 family)
MRLDSCGGVHNRYIPSLSATSYDRPEVDNGCHVTIAWRNHPVSDRALKVAAFRALESECPDSFVHDPFASRLASERGMAMLRGLPQPEMMRLGIGVRCRFMDELPLEALASKPITTVLSVGCGLDTRPWRLELSPDPRWIEVYFADILDYKDTLMSAQTLRCRRERITADLNDAVQRRIIYAAAGPAPALMITEGLLTYLPAATVEALAAEAWQESGIAYWMSDIMTTTFAKAINMDTPRGRSATCRRPIFCKESCQGPRGPVPSGIGPLCFLKSWG